MRASRACCAAPTGRFPSLPNSCCPACRAVCSQTRCGSCWAAACSTWRRAWARRALAHRQCCASHPSECDRCKVPATASRLRQCIVGRTLLRHGPPRPPSCCALPAATMADPPTAAFIPCTPRPWLAAAAPPFAPGRRPSCRSSWAAWCGSCRGWPSGAQRCPTQAPTSARTLSRCAAAGGRLAGDLCRALLPPTPQPAFLLPRGAAVTSVTLLV